MNVRDQRGFSLIELLVVALIIFIVVGVFGLGLIGGVACGNYWYTEAGVLEDLRIDHPDISRILRTRRSAYSYSVIEVENQDGSRASYELDTNILFNYEFHRP